MFVLLFPRLSSPECLHPGRAPHASRCLLGVRERGTLACLSGSPCACSLGSFCFLISYLFLLFLLPFLTYVSKGTYLLTSCGFRLHQSLETFPGCFLTSRPTDKSFTCSISGTSGHCTFLEHDLPPKVCFSYITLNVISTDIKLITLARS